MGLDHSMIDPKDLAALMLIHSRKLSAEQVAEASKNQSRVQKENERGEKLDASARKRWPELDQEDSEFSRAVADRIELLGLMDDPTALYKISNEVGQEMGLQPSGTRGPGAAGTPPGKTDSGKDQNGDDGEDGSGQKFLKDTKNIREAFRNIQGIDVDDPKFLEGVANRVENPGDE